MKAWGSIYASVYILILHSFVPLLSKKVLVTGGAGFIGSHVSQRLLERGDSVVIVDDFNDYYNPAIKHNNISEIKNDVYEENQIVSYEIDICDKKKLQNVFEKERPDVICHLAARAGVRPSIKDAQLYCNVNILGTLNILECAKNFNIKNVVLASSSSVYGESAQAPFSENEGADRPVSPYAATKRSCELIAYTYHYLYNIPCTCLRFFTVYGPRGRIDMAPFIFVDAIYNEKPITVFGDGSAMRDFTYIDDIVDGVIKSIDKISDFEIFNLGRGEPIVLKDFIKTIEKVVGKKARIIQVSKFDGDVPLTHADISHAKNILNYQPTISHEDGIKYFYHWYLNSYLKIK